MFGDIGDTAVAGGIGVDETRVYNSTSVGAFIGYPHFTGGFGS